MKSVLMVGCLALVIAGSSRSAEACHGIGRGRGMGRLGSQAVAAGMATMRMIASQEQYAAAQRAEVHRKEVAAFSNLREQELARREARRQARLSSHNTSNSASSSGSSLSAAAE